MFDPGANGARLRAIGASLKTLIAYAWDKQLTQISGGPKWLDSDRFDIDARQGNIIGTPANWAQRLEMYQRVRVMLQSLLEDRFHLVVHNEVKQKPIYELLPAKGGPKLKDASAAEETPSYGVGRGQITGTGIPLSRLTILLSGLVSRQVIDKTGLTGRYDITLTYAVDGPQRGAPGPDAPPPVNPDTPSIFTALQEQLGLKLEPARAPVDVLVVDRAEKPDAN